MNGNAAVRLIICCLGTLILCDVILQSCLQMVQFHIGKNHYYNHSISMCSKSL